MKFKRLTAAIGLTMVLSASAVAGDGTPVCDPVPGIMQSPPCATAQLVNDESPSPPDGTVLSTDSSAITLSEATLDIVQMLVTIF